MIGKCMACGARFDPTAQGLPDHYDLRGVFEAKIITMTAPCPTCRRNHVVALNSARPLVSSCWRVDREVMKEERDYTWVQKAQITGAKRLYIAWLWLPITDDVPVEAKAIAAVLVEDFMKRTDVQTLLVMEENNVLVNAIKVLMPRFSGTLIVKPHVLAGAFGPYPSLRAERSIYQTWAGCNLGAIRHYWPAASLNPSDYVRLDDDVSLGKAWAQCARRNLVVSQPQE